MNFWWGRTSFWAELWQPLLFTKSALSARGRSHGGVQGDQIMFLIFGVTKTKMTKTLSQTAWITFCVSVWTNSALTDDLDVAPN